MPALILQRRDILHKTRACGIVDGVLDVRGIKSDAVNGSSTAKEEMVFHFVHSVQQGLDIKYPVRLIKSAFIRSLDVTRSASRRLAPPERLLLNRCGIYMGR